MDSGYNGLARFYNRYWTQEAPELFEKVLNRLLLSSLPEKASILDLCCGTGQMCARLSQRLFDMTGLDSSPEMLHFAKLNAPSASFVLADARDFAVDSKFDAVISLFDSINHMLEKDDLLRAFQCVKKALKPDGIFLFDVNDSKAFNKNWENGFSVVEDDSVCILKPTYEPKCGQAVYHITTFEKIEQEWSRSDIVVYERYYNDDEIIDTLNAAGFSSVQIIDGGVDLRIKAFRGRRFVIAS